MSKRTGGAARMAGAAAVGSGAALGTAAASACCAGPVVAPLMVGVLGAGGAAWAAALKPYAPYMLAGSLLLLLYAFRSAYRRPEACRLDGDQTAEAGAPVWLQLVLWAGAVLWVASLIVNLFLASP